MFVGIDVTHPSPGSSSHAPSVSVIVASVDKFPGQWPATLRIQCGRQEEVDELSEMLKSRFKVWKTKGKHAAFPKNILISRDGVSEGQYDMVLSKELPSLRKACEQMYLRPTSKRACLASRSSSAASGIRLDFTLPLSRPVTALATHSPAPL
jgi:eukaryotic translation initiation factor 2C